MELMRFAKKIWVANSIREVVRLVKGGVRVSGALKYYQFSTHRFFSPDNASWLILAYD